jgi:hypothetical protein
VSRRAVALALALPCACAFACGAGEPPRSPAVPPVTTSPPPAVPALVFETKADERRDASFTDWSVADAAVRPSPVRAVAVPSYGAAESPKPGETHPFRLVAAVRAMRASPSGAKIVKMLSLVPDVIDAKARTGVDPFAEGEWLLVYGSAIGVPGPNANVLKHARTEAELAKAAADGGFESWDAGAAPPGAGTPGALRGEVYGVRDVLLRPQAGLLALVPEDRARDLAAALAKPIDPGVKPGELARIFAAEPAKIVRFVPADVVRATVLVKPASDGGLDASAEADCADAVSCKTTATALEELAKRSNSMMVRIVLKNLLGGLAVRAEGTKLKATLHAAPDQVDAALGIVRAQLGLPETAPGP